LLMTWLMFVSLGSTWPVSICREEVDADTVSVKDR
jgi:hypothetical protein